MERRQFNDGRAAREFILAGNATITLVSGKTGVRFTYKVIKAKTGVAWFVSYLMGPDNVGDYTYLGLIQSDITFRLTKKSAAGESSTVYRAFQYMWQRLLYGAVADDIEIWHEGRCGRCGRKLTVPESIERGIGPECAGKV